MNRRTVFAGLSVSGVTIVIGLAVMMASLPSQDLFAAKGGNKPAKPLGKAFPHSEKCKRCHLRVFEEWETSAQSRSIETAAFRVSLDRYVASAAGKSNGNLCFRCHAPHILEYPDHASMFIEEVKSRDPQIDGVGCAQCHLIKQVDPKVHPPLPTFELGKTIFGSYKKAAENLAHQSMALDLYRNSQYCVSCHEMIPHAENGKNASLPDLMGDWQTTQAEKDGKTCQSCHMPEQLGESANGEKNRKTANHSFPGRFGKVRAEAATLDITTEVKGEQSEVNVVVQSLVPHNLPLPHPGWSRVVLDLTILGKNLRKVYRDQRFYERVFVDAKGLETVLDFEAVKVLTDTVLKPEEKRIETFIFPTPKDAPSMDVIVTMSYGEIHGPPDFLKAVEDQATLGRKDRAFQPVQIIKHKINVPLKK